MQTNKVKAAIESIALAAHERRLLLFCGAGISMLLPSNSPSWWGIYVAATKALASRFREEFPELQHALHLDELLAPLQTQQLADLIVSRFAGDTFVEILKVVDIADANANHMLIVAIAAKVGLRGIITTNWDTLLERTAVIGGVSFSVVAPGIPGPQSSDLGVPLIKMHGSAVDAQNLIETSSHKAREISPELPAAWNPLLAGSHLLVIGYSGADLNFGAAGAFFRAFAEAGGTIWWLHLPGNPPSLPEFYRERVVLVEGTLAEFLQEVAASVGASPFSTPVTNRSAQNALDLAMNAWAREFHIGKWSAATFFYTLACAADDRGAASQLTPLLEELARTTATRFVPGEKLEIHDMAAAGFFSAVGMHLLQRIDFEGAGLLLRATVNFYETFNQILAGDRTDVSFRERCMNLSSGWSNYGQTLIMSGKSPDSLNAFYRSLQYAYLGGNPNSFLVALTNVVHYGFELKEVRRCMRIVSAGIRVADRFGAVHPSIELRLLLASYHFDRNEIWIASAVLREAGRRAAAIGDTKNVRIAAIQQGALLLKSGKVRAGLTAIATITGVVPGTAFFFRPVEDVRRHLVSLGVSQESPFSIKLGLEQVDDLTRAIETVIAAAKDSQSLPWDGAHCRVSDSSAFDPPYLSALFSLGVHEFEGDSDSAARLGLALAAMMLQQGYFQDAVWISENTLHNPGASPVHCAHAHSIMAHACAELGRLDGVDQHLNLSRRIFQEANVPVPLATADVGLWHSIQSGNAADGVLWAEILGQALKEYPAREAACLEFALKMDSWGSSMATVAVAFRRAAAAIHVELPPGVSGMNSACPFRRFMGFNADLRKLNTEHVSEELAKAQQALGAQDPKLALRLIDELLKGPNPLPDHLAGVAIALQIHALGSEAAPQAMEKVLDLQRKSMLEKLAFSALARLEAAMAQTAISKNQPQLAEKIFARCGFIGEFADDLFARISFLSWELQSSLMGGRRRSESVQSSSARRAAIYYGAPEAGLFPVNPVRSPLASPLTSDVKDTESAFFKVVKSSQDASEVNAALWQLIRVHRAAAVFTREALARLRGELANRALRMKEFETAVRLYQKTERSFRKHHRLEDALNAMAGRARSVSRSGDYPKAVEIFEQALAEVGELSIRGNLLAGLASAHVLEGTRRSVPDVSLLDLAIARYREAIRVSPLESIQRAMARLGLARAHGEKGENGPALTELDQATAELAHLGAPQAGVLLKNRPIFESGEWWHLGLF